MRDHRVLAYSALGVSGVIRSERLRYQPPEVGVRAASLLLSRFD